MLIKKFTFNSKCKDLKAKSIHVTEACMEVQLFTLLDHTTSCFLMYLAELIDNRSNEERLELRLEEVERVPTTAV